MSTRTYTYTYTVQRFANPYLVCETCEKRAEGHIVAPGHRCLEHLGSVDHPEPVEDTP